MAKRSTSGIVCPRCGAPSAKVIGHSDSLPVIYLRCDDCGRALSAVITGFKVPSWVLDQQPEP
jgi:hypothetical protein